MGTAGYPPAYALAEPARANRVQRHLQTLGVLWCVYGAFRLVRGLIGIVILRAMTLHGFGDGSWPFGGSFGTMAPSWLHILLPIIAVVTVAGTILSFVTGYGLLTRKRWGRTLAMITAILSLIKFPVGTAMGIYTLWVLAPAGSAPDYEAISEP
ncbi:hypothetical protein [Granulicella arctica]|uniref:hypothetical protein n=1 Tax=Granulicella arctica TaxID=940613 RepID=UPI0021DF9AD7|nr:hypothetical protein [Granulicella arctica]